MRGRQKDQRAGDLGSPDTLGIWKSHDPFPKALTPYFQSPSSAAKVSKLRTHLELSSQAPALSSSESEIFRSLKPCPLCPMCTPSPSFVPGLAVGCRQHPAWGEEGSTAVKAPPLEEGHLPWLRVGRTLLTPPHFVTVVLGRWERG